MTQKVKRVLEKGEGISIEFKECQDEVPKSIYETVCAFLNRNGGDILLGVKDNKKIQGINKDKIEQIKKDFVTTINNSQKMSPPVYLSIQEVEIRNRPELIENDIFTIIIPLNPQDTPQDKILKFCQNSKTREEIQSN